MPGKVFTQASRLAPERHGYLVPEDLRKMVAVTYHVSVRDTVFGVLQSSDVVVLLALHRVEPGWTLRSLAERLGVQHSKVQRAVGRLERAGLYDTRKRQVIPHAADEFFVHALKYLHPIEEGAPTRGVPTAWAAEPLRGEIAAPEDLPPVWPDPLGTVRGLAVPPLDDSLPRLMSSWPDVAEMAALLDALRLGDVWVREAATRLLHERLLAPA